MLRKNDDSGDDGNIIDEESPPTATCLQPRSPTVNTLSVDTSSMLVSAMIIMIIITIMIIIIIIITIIIIIVAKTNRLYDDVVVKLPIIIQVDATVMEN